MAKKRYAQVGTGGRARMYYEAVASKYNGIAEMVGFCDQSQTRMNYANGRLEELGVKKVPTYLPHEFEKMISETKPDIVIVTSVDRTHDDWHKAHKKSILDCPSHLCHESFAEGYRDRQSL